MSSLRALVSDLVEKRLWPVALLLVVALLAVPFVLAKSPAPQPRAAATPAAVAAATPPSTPAVQVVTGPSRRAPLRGKAKNPFRQQYVPSEAATADGGGTAPVDTAPSGGSDRSDGAPAPPRSQPTYVYASVDVRFGRAGKRLHRIQDVPRLTPLPNPNHPIVVFLGMRRDRETAVFLVSTDVHVQGLGQCVPSPKDCEAIELQEGDTAFLDFTEADGTVKQYELDLDVVTLHTTTSEAVARGAYARVSRAGKLLVRSGSVHVSADGAPRTRRLPFHYVARRGVLHIAPWASKRARTGRARGAASGGHLADLTPAAR